MRYSYATVALPTLSPAEACAALRQAGFDGIEWKVGEAPYGRSSNATDFLVGNRCTLSEADGDLARKLAARHDLTVVGLGPYVQLDDVAGMRRVLDMSVRAGAPQVRVQAPRLSQASGRYKALRDRFVAFLHEIVPEGARRGARIAVEIHHNTIVPSVGLAIPILTEFAPTELGVIYDVGNMVYEGYEDYRIGIELLGPYLHHVHLKNVDARRRPDGKWSYGWAHLDDGLVDVSRVLGLLDDAGYTGWVSLEDLTFAHDSRAGIRYNADVLSRLRAPGWGPGLTPTTKHGNTTASSTQTTTRSRRAGGPDEFDLPDGGVDALLSALSAIDSRLPAFVYERVDPVTREPETTWIGLRVETSALTPDADAFECLRAELSAARTDGPDGGVFALLGYPHDATSQQLLDAPGNEPPAGLLLRLVEYLEIDHRRGVGRVVQLRGTAGTSSEEWAQNCAMAVPRPLQESSQEERFGWSATTSAQEYAEGVARFQAGASESGIGGVVLSVRMTSPRRADPVESYRVLRSINPSTCMFLIQHDDFALWGATSLSLAQITDRRVVAETDGATHPVPHLPDGETYTWHPAPKEIAEYDVVANAIWEDFTGIAEPGTQKFSREREQRVFFGLGHLFAEVQADLATGRDEVDAIRALFPHGAAVGHPREAATSLISEIEKVHRGPFSGAVGLFRPNHADTAAVTRSMWTTPAGSVTQAGAKVVPESIAEEEYAESVLKTQALRTSAREFTPY
ncbi:chorismate-binding protein [Pseudonocardia kujensis]|uniref:chorismate-binding protein n=1 Tax=Pseudonocardia kujensis TaxID=1128675 RepID=UPI001E316632|nr:chorismate-binding protein [Pseudonocardia kujensis]MCE0765283.1 chorismate-binding protein [Pseudonocardia kujensis]